MLHIRDTELGHWFQYPESTAGRKEATLGSGPMFCECHGIHVHWYVLVSSTTNKIKKYMINTTNKFKGD